MSQIASTVNWCSSHSLVLNKSKTKEIIFSLARTRPVVTPVVINDVPIDQVSSFKYLGTILTSNFDFTPNADAKICKAKQKLFIMKRLCYVKADKSIVRLCHHAFVCSILGYHLPVYASHLTARTSRSISSVTKAAIRITGVELPDVMESVADKRKNLSLSMLARDPEHPFVLDTEALPSGRTRARKARTACGSKCFRSTFTSITNSLFSR